MSSNALGEFLRGRRERLTPDDAGIPDVGLRRVSGLRREELAMVAGVSSPYYTRLEQGRDRNPSPQVLDAIGRALGLDEPAMTYMHRLAQAAQTPPRTKSLDELVSPQLQHIVEGWTDRPAVIVGRYRDVLSANALAQVLNPGFIPGRNLLFHTFLDPEGREYYLDWHEIAEGAVAGLRAAAGTTPDDPHFIELVGELSLKSDDFRQIWARQDVGARISGHKRYNNPFVGLITLDYETFTVNACPDQTLFLFHAEPGGPDEASLRLLGAIAGLDGQSDTARGNGELGDSLDP